MHSFDLVSRNEFVTAGDMAAVPLPDGSVDAAVFSLSLMGKCQSSVAHDEPAHSAEGVAHSQSFDKRTVLSCTRALISGVVFSA